MMRKQFIFIGLVMLASGVCHAQGLSLEYECPVASYMSGSYDTLDLYDVDGDGTREIVIRDVSGWPDIGSVIVLDNNYAEIWSYSQSGLNGDFDCEGFADMDGDGDREMIVQYYSVAQSAYAFDVVDYPSGEILGTLFGSSIRIFDFDGDGKMELAISSGTEGLLQIWGLAAATGVEVPNSLPLGLSQNSPNPFNPRTLIKYQVQAPGDVQLDIVDLRGHVVRTLVNEAQSSGDYDVVWDGTDQSGRRQASGSYLYVLHVGEFTASRKMLLLK